MEWFKGWWNNRTIVQLTWFFSITCGFIDRLLGHTKSSKLIKVHAMQSILKSRVMPGSWEQEWTGKVMKIYDAKVYEFKKEIVEHFLPYVHQESIL